ncbi:MAG: SHOCT domain-containing protein [Gloeocapsa sp. UFS-A4-WI-NPMV-4B04]|jgi:hypothetical protein|nr:SHOCT domain-containing protein [Gloeocapsa sp. UFS-A4-WI-NPMV-4B04]
MVDTNKLKELREALTEGLITQEEYEELRKDIIKTTKPNLQNLLTDKLKNKRSDHSIPADGLQHLIINNNNNNQLGSSGCYQNTALHLTLSLFTGGIWLIFWFILALFKI